MKYYRCNKCGTKIYQSYMRCHGCGKALYPCLWKGTERAIKHSGFTGNESRQNIANSFSKLFLEMKADKVKVK